MSSFMNYIRSNNNKQITYGKHQDTMLVLIDNGLIVEVDGVTGGVSGDTEYFRHEGEEVSWARGTGPRFDLCVKSMAKVMCPLDWGYLNLDPVMRREAARATSLGDLNERARSLFAGLIEDPEEKDTFSSKIDVFIGRRGYELRYCGNTVLWREGDPAPVIQGWMTTTYEWQ